MHISHTAKAHELLYIRSKKVRITCRSYSRAGRQVRRGEREREIDKE